MSLKHTPGPWKAKETNKETITIVSPWSDKVKPESCDGYGSYLGIHISEIKHQNDNPCVSKMTADANARLIAAAPEMIEIIISDLRMNLKFMSFGDITFMRQETNSEFNKKIDIVEKATGLTIEEVLNVTD